MISESNGNAAAEPLIQDEMEETLLTLIATYPNVEPTLIIHVLRICEGNAAMAANLLADEALSNATDAQLSNAARISEQGHKTYSIIFPSCSPEVQEALEEVGAGRVGCDESARYSRDDWTDLQSSGVELEGRIGEHAELTQTLLSIMEVAEQAAVQRKEHIDTLEENMQTKFALASPEKLLARTKARQEASQQLLPIVLDKQALDQLNTSALPFILANLEPLTMDASASETETPVGVMKLENSSFTVALEFDPARSQVHLDVTPDCITIELSKFDVRIDDCALSWERTECPRIGSGGELAARAVDCALNLKISAEEIVRQLEIGDNRSRTPERETDSPITRPCPRSRTEPEDSGPSPPARPSPRCPGRPKSVDFTVRKVTIEPKTVKIERLLSSVQDSWLGLLYNWFVSALKPQLIGMIEGLLENGLKDMEKSISTDAEWVSITILAILQGAKLQQGCDQTEQEEVEQHMEEDEE
eukprot:TRINITY_DN55616_c0_g2_i2.p1 TRINITY_DN55616_c0_g2~~TRINITY_DN55616_c0_g2_i2.p1  ORF type:complete len:476 (+),score=72.80 TRINITY_DN55616_c0_g2_i2:218-1645(+)